MNARQRYLAAVNRQPTDRPPFDLMGTACGLFDGIFSRLKAHKGVTSPDRSFRKGQNVGLYNDQLLEALEIDARRGMVREFGRDICFHGAADTIKMLRGSTEGVRQGVRQLCKDFSGGHWIVASANHFQNDIPAENICALYDTVREFYKN